MEKRVKKYDGFMSKRSFAEIVAALLGKEDRIYPSEYMEQVLLTTPERMDLQLRSRSRQHAGPIQNDNDFEPIPSVLIFQQFAPGKSYQLTLTVRNNAKVPRCLKCHTEESGFFSVEFRGSTHTSAVAPGLAHVYTVKFTPDAKKDYEYNLEFTTDSGSFNVSVIAIGPRAILDFPDKIEIPATGVKISSFKSMLIRNIGNAKAVFSLRAKDPRFSIEPSRGEIGEEEAAQFTVYFLSKEARNFQSHIHLQYDTGETLEIAVRCSATNCPIRLDRTSLRIEETYIGLSKSKTITIQNRSEYIVKYQWLLLENEKADEEYRQKYELLFQSMCVMQLPRCVDLVYHETCTPDTHEIACQRIHSDELEILKHETFLYKHKGFTFVPNTGEIWPQSSAEVTVHFNAFEFGEIVSTAYLEVTGLEDRIPLSLHGTGKGPVFRLNVVTIDMQNIYLCSKHNYEIVVVNDGHIPGTLIYNSKPTDFGGVIEINPGRLSMGPGEQKSFNLYFSSNKKGNFIERIDFLIDGTTEILSLHIKGQIICPTLHFDRYHLEFQTTALGFSTAQDVLLRNMSSVPVTFSITVENDGDERPLTYEHFMNSSHKPCFPCNPKEFDVTPADGVVSALQSVTITIVYTANIARDGATAIRVDMWDSDSDPVILPVSFSGKVAPLWIAPPEIVVRFCFLNFPYSRTFVVENKSSLDGFFVILPQSVSDSTPIVYSLSTYQGFIKAHQSREVNATIMTRMLGKQKTSLSMLVMGEKSPAEFCVVECNGQGPVVSVQPTALDFGEVRVLQEKTLVFSLISDSPIPADFRTSLEKKNSPWTVSPTAGNLEPNGSMEISVKLNLRDPGIYADNVVILVVSSRPIQVQLSAIGTGCGVVFTPPIFPILDIGPLFSKRKLVQSITVENKSTINYQILWSNVPEFHIPKASAAPNFDTIFQVQPVHFELVAGTTKIVYCRLRSSVRQSAQEDWYVFAQVLPIGKREMLGQTTLTATLAEPNIIFDKTELSFEYSVYPSSEDLLQTDEFTITNKTALAMTVHLTVKAPFHFVTDDNRHVDALKMTLPKFESKTIRVFFSPDALGEQSSEYTEAIHLTYDETPDKKDKIICKAVVHIPELTLSTTNLTIDCELGSCAAKGLNLINKGSVPVMYEFLWVGGTIKVDRYSEILDPSKEFSTPFLQDSQEIPIHYFNDLSALIKEAGDGDGPKKTASVSRLESWISEVSILETQKELQTIRDILMPIVKPCCASRENCSCTECVDQEPCADNVLDRILKMIPCQGVVPPYSTESVSVRFCGHKPICAVARIMCKIVRGSSEEINLIARSDVARFSVDKNIVDFGEQLFGEVCHEKVSLINDSKIALAYRMQLDEDFGGGDQKSNCHSELLSIEPCKGRVEPGSSVEFNIEYRSIMLGPIEFQLTLKVAHLDPKKITVKVFGAIPQVSPCVPYEALKESWNSGLDYRGIQLLTPEFVVKRPRIVHESCEMMEQLTEEEFNRLANEGWDVVPYREIVPTIIDVNMAIERLLARTLVNKNYSNLTRWSAIGQESPIPGLTSLRYVIDMNYIIVGLTAHYTTHIINYGPSKPQVRVKRSIKTRNALKKMGIVVQFHWTTNLTIGDSVSLRVTWHAKPANFSERETNVKQTIHLEVIRGFTIPIVISGTVTYPCISVNTKFLEFNDTIIGECSVRHFLVKNEGLITCQYSVELASGKKQHDAHAFRVIYDTNSFAPGESGFIRVYFKPHKPGRVQDKMNVIVEMGQEVQTVNLVGFGIALKVNIVEAAIKFEAAVPFSAAQRKDFYIENQCQFPVEYFWHHLDRIFKDEDRICSALTHYYNVSEIVVPRRALGESFPQRLVDFYDTLLAEMARDYLAEFPQDGNPGDDDDREEEEDANQNSASRRKPRRSSNNKRTSTRRRRQQKSKEYSSDSSGEADPAKEPEKTFRTTNLLEALMSRVSPDSIDGLLHDYIDKIHEDPDYRLKRPNPVQELFDELESVSADSIHNGTTESPKPKRKLCIIFHGAPFTEYQETACRAAHILGVPVLSVNATIIEAIAYGDNPASEKLRVIIDDAYNDYMAAFARQNKAQGDSPTRRSETKEEPTKIIPRKSRSPVLQTGRPETPLLTPRSKSSRANDPDDDGALFLQWQPEENPREEFNRIPDPDDLEGLDALSRYEYKIAAILALEKIVLARAASGSSRGFAVGKASVKSGRKPAQDETFLRIDPELLAEALQNRLSEKDLQQGFIVDTLSNNFFNDYAAVLRLLLKTVGQVEFMLLIVFWNTAEICGEKIRELRDLKIAEETERLRKKVEEIDEMSGTEYELLPEEDRKIYLDAVVPTKKAESLQRRMLYNERWSNLKKTKRRSTRTSLSKTAKDQRTSRKPKSKSSPRMDDDKKSPRRTKGDSAKIQKKTRAEPAEVDKAASAMEKFYSDFYELSNVFHSWDPTGRAPLTQVVSTARTKVPQTAKSSRKAEASDETPRNNFHTWYVRSSDPWTNTMYNLVVTMLTENVLIKDIIEHPVDESNQTVKVKVYSVLTSKGVVKRKVDLHNDAFQLVHIPKTVHPVPTDNSQRTEAYPYIRSEQKSDSMSLLSYGQNTPLTPEALVEVPVRPRHILQANETQKFRVYFDPWRCGDFERIFALTLADSYNVTYDILVNASADVPRLDMKPEAVFPRVEQQRVNEEDVPTYFLEDNVFAFGSLLLPRNDGRVHRSDAELRFRNKSKLNAEVEFFLSGTPSSFSLHPQKLQIPAGKTEHLIMSATAAKYGQNTETLHICVKNNPKVETIELLTNGTMLDVYLSDKEVLFNRVLLYRTELHNLIIFNKCAVSLYWCFKDDSTESQIMLQPSRGVIKPWSEEKVQISYYGSTVGVESREIAFHAFLSPLDQEPIFTEVVHIWGKTYDVAVDITRANPIDFSSTVVNNPKGADFDIKNRGEHDVKYIFTVAGSETLATMIPNAYESLSEDIEIFPVTGLLAPQKETVIQVTFTPKCEVIINDLPILTCHLLDVYRESRVIAEIPLRVSAAAYYNAFTVHPAPEVDFGPLGPCAKKTMYLTIRNLGKFPFQYAVCSAAEKHELEKSLTIKKEVAETKKAATTKKEKKGDRVPKVATPGALKIGPMTIERTKGEIAVDESDEIPIICYPEVLGAQEEVIAILVPNSEPGKQLGKLITLKVNCCLPCVDFNDLDSIFQGNYLVDEIENFYCPPQLAAHTVFCRQEKSLHFRRVKLFCTHTASFRLYNRSLVPAEVQVNLQSSSFTPKTKEAETFSVEPEKAVVPATSCKEFRVTFAPTLIDTFKGALEVAVLLPPSMKNQTFLIKLIGQSCLPEIVILEPVRGNRSHILLSFGRSLINEKREKEIVLKNSGLIEAKVVVDIFEDTKSVFSISASEESRVLPAMEGGDNESLGTCTVMRLTPETTTDLQITFLPNDLGKFEAEIRLSVVDNPYESVKVVLEGEGFTELIVLEDLELAENKERRSYRYRESKTRKITSRTSRPGSITSASGSSVHPAALTYNLDYGLCFVSKMYRKSFKIANKSTDRWFRFQWSAHPDIVFIPTTGYLKYQTAKEISANFLAGEPRVHSSTCIECELCEIKVDESSGALAWDDRQTEVRWENVDYSVSSLDSDVQTVMRKVVEPTAQPTYEVFAGSTKHIHVLLNATVAYSEYTCSASDVHFEDTLMLQKREFTIVLSNPGAVNLVYSWKLDMDERYPRRFAENSPKALSRPENGHMNTRPSKDHFHLPTPIDYEESPRPSDLFSSSAGLTDRSFETKLESYDFPFKITPSEGSVLPGESADCILEFAPKDVFYYKATLTCKMENLNPELPHVTMLVTARSLLPYCHFEIKESDYVTGQRRSPTQPGPIGYDVDDPTLWENIRVIEFKVIGVGATHVKKFELINPTTENYRFTWKDRTFYSGEEVPKFHCLTPEGLAARGKGVELAFTFLAEDVGTFESFWLFCIDTYDLKSLFLLVAVVAEPLVHSLTVDLKLKPAVLGNPVSDSIKIINEENFNIPFRISQQSLCSEGKSQDLTVSPMEGELIAKQEQTFSMEYHPTLAGEFNFRVQCHVKWMKNPLIVCVSARVHTTMSSVFYTDARGETKEALENTKNTVDFGKLMVAEAGVVEFDISNSGEMPFYFAWDLGIPPRVDRHSYIFKISDLEDELPKGSRLTCALSLVIFERRSVKDHPVILKIYGGPTYKFSVNASAKKPSVKFSFNQHDFGACYIREDNVPGYEVELFITNSEHSAFVIECAYEEKPHILVNLESLSEALKPRSTIAIPVIFRPLKEAKYSETLTFTINRMMEKKIVITGEGITYKIRLVNPRDKLVDLGNVLVNRTITKRISVTNEGLLPVTVQLGLMKDLRGYQEHREKTRDCAMSSQNDLSKSELESKRSSPGKTGRSSEIDLAEVLIIEPSADTVLPPSKKTNVIVKFKPTRRMKPFAEKIAVQTSTTILPLFVVRGSCVGPAFQLNKAQVSFGAVVQNYVAEARILLMNTGDIGARFRWNTTKLPRDFTISPVTGYCTPGMDVSFLIRFQPTREYSLLEANASIEIEKYGLLNVKVSGSSCNLPDPVDTLFFEASVRDKDLKAVRIPNDSNSPWELKPEIIGEHFATENVVTVPPKTAKACLITYYPITMTAENSPHTGTLVLKIPGGNPPILYSLHGTALPPPPLDTLIREFPAKTKYTESLTVYNWLNRQERFFCNIELRNEAKETPLFNFNGSNTIDIPANSQRDYRAVFHSYEEYDFYFTVTFANQEDEYQYYEINYKVTSPEVIESIKLSTIVRNPACYSLKLQNPMEDREIIYSVQCSHPTIKIHGAPKTVLPLSHEYISIKYDPLLALDETIVPCDVFCPELGRFPYELRLKALAAPPEKVTHVTATLGCASSFTLPIKNYSDKNCDFTVTVSHDALTCEKKISVPKQKEYQLEVVYEPYDAENIMENVVASSNTAGEYIFPVIATYSLPKPCGPYTVRRKGGVSIPFKNIFRETKTFNLILEPSELFYLDSPSETIHSKQTITVKVRLQDSNLEESETFGTDPFGDAGKLVINCAGSEFSHINWIYYLRAEMDETTI